MAVAEPKGIQARAGIQETEGKEVWQVALDKPSSSTLPSCIAELVSNQNPLAIQILNISELLLIQMNSSKTAVNSARNAVSFKQGSHLKNHGTCEAIPSVRICSESQDTRCKMMNFQYV